MKRALLLILLLGSTLLAVADERGANRLERISRYYSSMGNYALSFVLRGGGALLGIVLAIMVAIAGVVMLPFSATLGLLFAGGLELFLGIRSFSQNGADSISTIGLGALLLGLGVAALFFSIKLYKKSIPWIIKKIKSGSDRIKAFADKNGKI